MRHALFTLTTVAALLLAACGGGGSKATPTPSTTASPTATAATASPSTVTGHPAGTRTGNADVDAVVKALESGDGEAIDALVDWEAVPCRAQGVDAGQPECPAGTANGTVVEAIRQIGCDWKWHVRPSDHRQVALAVAGGDRLWSVWSGPPFEEQRGADAELIYVDAGRPGRFKAVFLRAGRLVVDYRGCEGGFDELGVRGWSEVFRSP